MTEMKAAEFWYLMMNTIGVNKTSRCKKLLNFLKNHKIIIALLILHQWQGQIFYLSFASQSRGVATLIDENVSLHVDNVEKDKQGRYLYLKAP